MGYIGLFLFSTEARVFVCHILMFITACDIYIKSENESRLYILLYYELKFNRNNLFMFEHIFSIKN